MDRVVIAGAGFGGIATAVRLRADLDPRRLEIVLVDRRAHFMMGLRKTWAALGIAPAAEGVRRLEAVRDVHFVRGEIERIDPARRALTVDGREIAGDALVLALGARQAPEAVPGLAEHGINVWDAAQVERAQAALAGMREGRLVIGVFGTPYACPPGPYEFALLARDRLGPAVDVVVFAPMPIALPAVGPAESAKLEAMLQAAGIEFLPGRRAASVSASEVSFGDGSTLQFDLLLAVPPHAVPPVLVEAGLAQPGGWVMPDRATMETGFPGVYAVGDCTAVPLANGLALPKAGVIAASQGEVVAARIAANLGGIMPQATYAGEVYCYIETGGGRAAMANGLFYEEPTPAVTISAPTAQQLDDKRQFEAKYLTAWFGDL